MRTETPGCETTTEAVSGAVPREAPAPRGVLLLGPAAAERVAGVPVGARAALLLERAGCSSVHATEAHRSLGSRARGIAPLADLRAEVGSPVVVVVGDVVFDRALAERLLAASRDGPAWAHAGSGFVVATRGEGVRDLIEAYERAGLDGARSIAAASARELPDAGLLLPAATGGERKTATRAILRATGKAVDGPLTRLFERRISQAISGVLLPWPVSPNVATTVSLAIGLAGAGLLATVDARWRVLGAALFVFATIVDGVDGEIARAKLLESRFGKLFDTAVDIIVNASVFVGISVGVWREFGGVAEVWWATLALVAGGALAMLAVESVRRLAPRPAPETALAHVQGWAERFATMEWCYLVLALALVGQLPFFFWGAAIGANVFAAIYLALGVVAWRRA
jgi:phosphatidylglycerophosphate synthase